MQCEAARELISGWIDRQLAPNEAAALDSHLSQCAECRGVADSLRAQDADLLRAFQPLRESGHRLAERIVNELRGEQLVARAPVDASRTRWSSLTLAAAAGFLIAVILFQPWRHLEIGRQNPIVTPEPPVETPAARLVLATGKVQMRPPGSNDWQVHDDPENFSCRSDSVIRTGPDVRCELKTSEGCVIRLNGETEVTITSGSSVEIGRGQIWCSSPDNVSLKVMAAKSDAAQEPIIKQPLWTVACPSSSCMVTGIPQDGDVQVTTSEGEVELQTPQDRRRLTRGQSASIVDNRILEPTSRHDPVLAASWMAPLLARKGHGNPELTERVNQLLAQMGRSKVTMLYEQEIRGLGEYAALPLLRYVESPLSKDDPHERQEAMRILADVAPAWAVSDFIALLGDADPETRVYAAGGLARLTGLDQGRPAEKWRDALDQCQPSIEAWKQWWTEYQEQYLPPLSVLPRIANVA